MKNRSILPLLLILILPVYIYAQYVERDWEERDGWMDVPQILRWAGVEAGDKVADIGCHEGYLSMHLAREVGNEGKVFAVDVMEHRINSLRGHAAARSLPNITTILGEYDDPRLPVATLDVAFLVDTYHEINDYMTVLGHIRRSLKPGGRIVILEKLKDRARGKDREGQVAEHTLSPHYVISELKAAGFQLMAAYEDLGDWENEKDKTIWLVIAQVPQV